MSASKTVNKTATSRLKQDYMRLKRDPVPFIDAEPLASNILEWHYVVRGPDDSTYKGGYYHGKLVFPREFPFKPPSIYMFTPNGRFKCNTRLCLSISDFHPDTWNPAWSVATILTGLLSFMLENTPTLGSIETSISTKRKLAEESGPTNLKNATFCELFPELVKEIQAANQKREEEARRRQQQQTATGAGGEAAESKPTTWVDGAIAAAADANVVATDCRLDALSLDSGVVEESSDNSELSELSEDEGEEENSAKSSK